MSSAEANRAAQLASRVDFGIVTALPVERAAVLAMLDAPVPYVVSGRGAGRTYDLGEIRSLTGGTHTVAVALAGMGNNVAATRGSLLLEHFEQVDAILMVGIAGGVPWPEKPEAHVRLGDVVVSEGIVQFDFVKKTRRNVEYRHPPRPACARLLESFNYLVSDEQLTGTRPWETHMARSASIHGATRPAATSDLLASTAEPNRSVAHPPDPQRREGLPRIFRGMIGSSGTLLKDARERDRLRDKFGIRAVEMEASGIADATWTHGVGFIAVRGICDYCDGNKNDLWHVHAAVAAAAYARALLERTASCAPRPTRLPASSEITTRHQSIDDDLDETKKLLEEHHPEVARTLLERIRRRQWYDLPKGRQFRILSQIGHSYLMEGNTNKASEHFLEAKKLQPDDEKARANEVLAYEIRGETDRAHEMAAGLMTDFPNSDAALGLWLRTAPPEESAEEQEHFLIGTHRQSEEALIAVAFRAINCGDFSRAERLALAVMKTRPTLVPARFLLAKATWQSALRDLGRDVRELDEGARARLQVSARYFDEAIALAEVQRDKLWKADCLLGRAAAWHALDESAQAERDFIAAERLVPEEPAVQFHFGQFLWSQERFYEAVGHLQAALEGKARSYAKFFLALSLRRRGSQGDAHRANLLFTEVAQDADCEFSAQALPLAIGGMAEERQFANARNLVKNACSGAESPLLELVLMGTISVAEGDVEGAVAQAHAALKAWTANVELDLTRRLVDIFARLQRYADALPLCEHVFGLTGDLKDGHNLIASAQAAKRDDVALRTCRKLRECGDPTQDIRSLEFELLQKYDVEEAVKVLEDHVRRYPEDRHAHLVLAVCRFRLRGQEAFSVSLNVLPLPEDLNPDFGALVVDVLRQATRASDAVRYGYALVRHHYGHQGAHRAFCMAMLPVDEEASDLEVPSFDHVEPGVAVYYVMSGDATEHWLIIADEQKPTLSLNEYGPAHSWGCELLGKAVGDSFNIPGTGVQPRAGTIKRLLSKYICRYHDSLSRMATDFGKETGWVMGHVAASDDIKPAEALKPMLAQMDAGHVHGVIVDETYQNNYMSVHQYAQMAGRPDFEAFQMLLGKELNIRCQIGDPTRQDDVRLWLGEVTTIVIDLTAILTLHALGQIDLLSKLPVELIVSQGTMEELRNAEREARRGMKHRSGLARAGLVYHWVETPPDLAKEVHRQMVALLDAVAAHCTVASGCNLAAMAAEERNTMISFFGWHGAESLAIATANDYVIWTDDLTLEAAGRAKLGLQRRVWTQAMLQFMLAKPEDRDQLAICGAKLLGWGYSPVDFDINVLLQACELAHWNTSAWPLRRAIASFGDKTADFGTWLSVARDFIIRVEERAVVIPGAQATYRRMLEGLKGRREAGAATAVDDMLRTLPPDVRRHFWVSQHAGVSERAPIGISGPSKPGSSGTR